MENITSVSGVIKRYIKMRGRTVKQVAADLNVNYKTLDGRLNRNKIEAEMLFEIANLLDIDLCWMSHLFNKHRTISCFEPYQMPRMSSEFRENELPEVLNRLDSCIRGSAGNISEAKNEFLKSMGHIFYILDVLLPDSYMIRVTIDRGKEKYYCIPCADVKTNSFVSRGRPACGTIYEGHEMLKIIIAVRKENLK